MKLSIYIIKVCSVVVGTYLLPRYSKGSATPSVEVL